MILFKKQQKSNKKDTVLNAQLVVYMYNKYCFHFFQPIAMCTLIQSMHSKITYIDSVRVCSVPVHVYHGKVIMCNYTSTAMHMKEDMYCARQ